MTTALGSFPALFRAEAARLLSRRILWGSAAGLVVLGVGAVAIGAGVALTEGAEPSFVEDFAFDPALVEDQPAGATSVMSYLMFLVPFVAFSIGASSIGAELRSGVVESLLIWEPRRRRLLAARSLAGFVLVGVLGTAISAFHVGAQYALAAGFGDTAGMTPTRWGWVLAAIVRLGLISAVFSVAGTVVTFLTGSSAGSIVGFVLLGLVISPPLRIFVPGASAWLPTDNAEAFVAHTNVLTGVDLFAISGGEPAHGYLGAGLYLVVLTGLLAAVAARHFDRAEIT